MCGVLSLETLESYLDSDIDPQFEAEVQAHITDCERCQETLDLLARKKYQWKMTKIYEAERFSPRRKRKAVTKKKM